MLISMQAKKHKEERKLICMRSLDGWCDNPKCYDDGGKCPYGEDEESHKTE